MERRRCAQPVPGLVLTYAGRHDVSAERPQQEHVLEHLRTARETDPRTLAARSHLAGTLIGLGNRAGAHGDQDLIKTSPECLDKQPLATSWPPASVGQPHGQQC